MAYSKLTEEQIKRLEAQGCSAEDWGAVEAAKDFDPAKIKNVKFVGEVKVGGLEGIVKGAHGLEKPSGIYDATIVNCTIGNDVRIANVGIHVANYDIEEKACIENVGTIQTNTGATFGNGVKVEVLNEAGGREVILFNELSAQFAYMMCVHRHRPKLIEKLAAIANNYVQSVRADRGKIGVYKFSVDVPEMDTSKAETSFSTFTVHPGKAKWT